MVQTTGTRRDQTPVGVLHLAALETCGLAPVRAGSLPSGVVTANKESRSATSRATRLTRFAARFGDGHLAARKGYDSALFCKPSARPRLTLCGQLAIKMLIIVPATFRAPPAAP